MANRVPWGVDIRRLAAAVRGCLPHSDAKKAVLARATCLLNISAEQPLSFEVNRNVKLKEASAPSSAGLSKSVPELQHRLVANDRVLLVFDEKLAFMHELRIPKSVSYDVGRIMGMRLSQLLPGSLEAFHRFSWITEEGSNSVLVRQAVIKKDVLQKTTEIVEGSRASVLAVALRLDDGDFAPAMLTRKGENYESSLEVKWLKLFCASVLLYGAAAAASVQIVTRELDAKNELIQARIPAAQAEAEKVRKTLDAQLKIRDTWQKLTDVRRNNLQLPSLLAAMTRSLPAKAWLQKLTIDRDQGYAEGMAEDAEALVKLLEASGPIENVTFAAPVTQVPNSSKQRFALKFQMKQRQ